MNDDSTWSEPELIYSGEEELFLKGHSINIFSGVPAISFSDANDSFLITGKFNVNDNSANKPAKI